MWDDIVPVIFFLVACPFIVAGPLMVFLAVTGWQSMPARRRLIASIAIGVMATLSFLALFYISEFWVVRLYFVAVFWALNVPVIALIVLLRKSDRFVEAAARRQTFNKTSES